MAEVTLTWVGGEHTFALRLGNLRAVQKHCDAGPEEILQRIMVGNWRVDDLFETIRQGLLGGGMSTSEASELVTGMMSRHPLTEFKLTAQGILAAALIGVEDDMPGEQEGEALTPKNGASPNSTQPEQ